MDTSVQVFSTRKKFLPIPMSKEITSDADIYSPVSRILPPTTPPMSMPSSDSTSSPVRPQRRILRPPAPSSDSDCSSASNSSSVRPQRMILPPPPSIIQRATFPAKYKPTVSTNMQSESKPMETSSLSENKDDIDVIDIRKPPQKKTHELFPSSSEVKTDKSISAPPVLIKNGWCQVKITSYTMQNGLMNKSYTMPMLPECSDTLNNLISLDKKNFKVCFDFDCTLTVRHFYHATTVYNGEPQGIHIHNALPKYLEESRFPSFEELDTETIELGFKPYKEWCESFFGTKERLTKLANMFTDLKLLGRDMYILTRGNPQDVAFMLHSVGLLKFIKGINGINYDDYSRPTVWYDVVNGKLSEPVERKYNGKDHFIFEAIKTHNILYVDDDPEEHNHVVRCLNRSINKDKYYNVGQGSAVDNTTIQNNCIEFSNFSKNGEGVTFEMMDLILKICK